jgi:glutamate N-acetyltransferase/amino-acid N-acetyltransferase
MNWKLPQGFSLGGVYCGLKRKPGREDLSLIVSDLNCVACGVFTRNQVVAAPVQWDRDRTPSERIRAIVINSGNANACTGKRGLDDARQMAQLTAQAIGTDVQADQVLVLSTGIIGEHLPMPKIAAGIEQAARTLGTDQSAVLSAARGMLTTDSRHKVADRSVRCGGREFQLFGMAKGAAMIGPKMATMLAVVLTDGPISAADAQPMLRDAVDESFNCISVEGHTSTNDTVLLLARRAPGQSNLTAADREAFSNELREMCIQLACEIPADGEGATHLIEICVGGCGTREEAHRIARAIADSPLVKTAIAGADPNWGRIVSAAGYSGVAFDPATASLRLNEFLLFHEGTPVAFDASKVSASIRDQRTTRIDFQLQRGDCRVRFWTCDLTAEYVRLNADYHT